MILNPFEQFLRGYIAALLWSSTDEVAGETVHLDQYPGSTQITERCRSDCKSFWCANHEDIKQAAAYYDLTEADGADTGYDFAGHDFALTRNGHGAGFWDRSELPEEVAQRLTEACEAFGSVTPYLGDDGHVYIA